MQFYNSYTDQSFCSEMSSTATPRKNREQLCGPQNNTEGLC